jgi:NitT/TauT family transport system permease protein
MKNNIFLPLKKHCLSIFSVAVFFAAWEIIARLKLINPLFISSPLKVYLAGYELIRTGEIFPHLFASLEALFFGLFLAIIFGTIAGLLIGSNKTLYEFFSPYVYALSSLPTVAVIPLIIIWFGIGIYAKIAIVFLMALKPLLINIIDGVRKVDSRLTGMARSFRASNFFIIRTITIYSVLEFAFSGLRISVGRSITGLIVGEAFGYGKGLGFLVSFYGNTFQTARLMFLISLFFVVSLFLISLVNVAEKKIIRWKT